MGIVQGRRDSVVSLPMPRNLGCAPSVPLNCQNCSIRKSTICQPLMSNQLEVVETYKSGDRILPAGSLLYREGEPCPELYNLLDGWVVLCRYPASGRRLILDFVLPGAFFGYQADLMAPMRHEAECLTDVAVCVFPRRPFPSFLERHPPLALSLARLQAGDELSAHNHLTNIGARPARARVAHLLLELYVRVHGRHPEPGGVVVDLPINQHHIADALGLTNVHVNKALRALREEGLLLFKSRQLEILDPIRLSVIAEFSPETVLNYH